MPSQNIMISVYRQAGATTPSGAQDPVIGGWARTDGGFIDFEGTYDNDGIASAETENTFKQAVNRMARFRGEDYLLLGGRVYKWNSVSDAWATSLNLTALASETGSSRNIGLYPMHLNNTPYLVTAWQSGNTSTWASARLNGLTNVWETGALGTVFNASEAGGSILNEIQHRNRIYFISSNTTSIGVYDAELNSFSTSLWPAGGNPVRHPMDFAVYSGVLYCVNKNSSSQIVLHKIGSTNELVIRLGQSAGISTPTSTNNLEGRNCLFVDNSQISEPRMYALTMRRDTPSISLPNGRWTIFEMRGTVQGKVAQTRILQSKVPFNSFGGEEQIYRAFADHRNRWLGRTAGDPTPIDPINTSHYNFSYRPDGEIFSSYSRAFWDGAAGGAMPGSTLGASVPWTWAHDKVGNGTRVSERTRLALVDARMMDISLNSIQTLPKQRGKVRIHFDVIQASGKLNGTPCGVRWFYDVDGHTPQKQCTLSNPSQGSISGVHNLMAGIEIGGGPFSVDWHAREDGVSRFSHVNLLGHVVTTGVL